MLPPYYMSAYTIAKAHGFSGTEEEWLVSLLGSRWFKGTELTGQESQRKDIYNSLWGCAVPGDFYFNTETGYAYFHSSTQWEYIGRFFNGIQSVNGDSSVNVVLDAFDIPFSELLSVGDVLETLQSASHYHANKTLLDTYAQTEENLADAVSKKHSHENKALLDTYAQTEESIADAVEKKHSHSNKSLLDTYTQTESNLSDAVSKKHEHTNKSILDDIDSTDISNWNGKSVVSGTNDGTNWNTITINGTTKEIPQGGGSAEEFVITFTGSFDDSGEFSGTKDKTYREIRAALAHKKRIVLSWVSPDEDFPLNGYVTDVINNTDVDLIMLSAIIQGSNFGFSVYSDEEFYLVIRAFEIYVPNEGIPLEDLEESVQESLGKADTSIQPSDYNPYDKTEEMTQAVGKDGDGKLWTIPGGGGGGGTDTNALHYTVDVGKTDSAKQQAKKNMSIIKSSMDSVAVAEAQYYLGEKSSLTISMPTNASVGQSIVVCFSSGATPCVLTCDLTGFDFVPKANKTNKLIFTLIHKSESVGDDDKWIVETEES